MKRPTQRRGARPTRSARKTAQARWGEEAPRGHATTAYLSQRHAVSRSTEAWIGSWYSADTPSPASSLHSRPKSAVRRVAADVQRGSGRTRESTKITRACGASLTAQFVICAARRDGGHEKLP